VRMFAEEVVWKLALDMEKHPTLYYLEWLKKGNEIIVSKRCLVNFSIRTKYKDNTGVTWWPWMHVTYCLGDRSNMIGMLTTMDRRIPITSWWIM
jgi:hypothetical protein